MKKTKKYLIEGGIFVFTFALTLFLFNNITRDAYAIDASCPSGYNSFGSFCTSRTDKKITGCKTSGASYSEDEGTCTYYLNCPSGYEKLGSTCVSRTDAKVTGCKTSGASYNEDEGVCYYYPSNNGTNTNTGGTNTNTGGTNTNTDETNIDTPDNQEITDNVLTATFVGGGYKNSSDNNNNTNGCILENGASSCNVQAFGFINTDGVEYEYWQCGDKKVNPYERFSISTDTICSAMKKDAGSIDEKDDNTSKGDSTPSKDTSGSKTTNVDKTDDELTSNSKTGSIMITIAYIVTIFTLGFGAVYYYRYRKQN